MSANHYTNNLPCSSDKLSRFSRLMVEPWNTSFYEGREFRMFKELSIAASATYVLRVVIGVNSVLTSTDIGIELGFLRAAVAVGGTPGGSFSDTITSFGANSMTAGSDHRSTYGDGTQVYTSQWVWTGGGTHTGGVETEVVRLKAGNNANQAVSVGGAPLSARGLPPGTYYIRFQNLSATDAITGVFRMRWEERP